MTLDYKEIIEDNFSTYIQGNSGIGKTTKMINYVKENNYEYTYITLQELKNEANFYEIINNRNIINFFNKVKNNRKVIIIDNIDYLQNSDKKLLSFFIKFFKDSSNKEKYNNISVVFIGINKTDKKVLELIEKIDNLVMVKDINDKDKNMKEIVNDIVTQKYNKYEDVKTEKTIISLCYHENIIYHINNDKYFYNNLLKRICIGDYYDRIAFQKQLWQFNEMTYILKVISNYDLYKTYFNTEKYIKQKDIIFTKILTKYSNEYSNNNFLIGLCNKLNLQKDELINSCLNNDINSNNNITNIEKKRIIKLLIC